MAFLGANTTTKAIPTRTGAWSSGSNYSVGQVVSNNSSNWIATTASTSSAPQTPDLGSAYWILYTGPLWTTLTLTTDPLLTLTNDRFTGSVYAYSSGGAGGKLYVDQSPDGTNWDISNFTKGGDYTVADSTATGFSEEIILPYVRLRYVATTNVPTTFRLFGRSANAGTKY